MTGRGNRRLKILVDLDVVTVALWEKEDERRKMAIEFIDKVKSGKFTVYTPYTLFTLLDRWGYEKLRDEIKNFYAIYSIEIVTTQRLTEKLDMLMIKDTDIVSYLKREDVKEEDIILVIITSVFVLDYLVTFNRKHLKNKQEVINNVLQK